MNKPCPHGIRITVQPEYLPDSSMPALQRWLFAYHVTIVNEGSDTVQLLHRHWIITNGEGETDEVRGAGVVGQQPTLAPGDSFSYSSGCPLDTPVGTMHGSYQMKVLAPSARAGETFDAPIAPFRLAATGTIN